MCLRFRLLNSSVRRFHGGFELTGFAVSAAHPSKTDRKSQLSGRLSRPATPSLRSIDSCSSLPAIFSRPMLLGLPVMMVLVCSACITPTLARDPQPVLQVQSADSALNATSDHSAASETVASEPSAETAVEESVTDKTPSPANSPSRSVWFVVSCLLLPVLWGAIVHQVFSRIRGGRRPRSDSGWPDYQI